MNGEWGPDRPLRLGTRRSALAVTQAEDVAAVLRVSRDVPVELVEIVSEGDRSSAAVAQLGGTGVFVNTLREALRAKEIDLAVHSLKDLPTEPAPDIVLAAVPVREDPRDVLVSRDDRPLAELPVGARIGTGSPRRMAQLLALGLGFEVVPIRGNVDTRLRKVRTGDPAGPDAVDAVVLARAGLARLGRLDVVSEVLDPLLMLPAPGQGALAVECREADSQLAAWLAEALDDAPTRAAVTAERSLLAALEAGCTAPVGALAEVGEAAEVDALAACADDRTPDDEAAEVSGLEVYLRAAVVAVDGSAAVRLSATGPLAEAAELGRRLADDLLQAGAADVMGTR